MESSYLPLISIIIPTFNRVKRLKRCLDSFIEDRYPYKEIIVCDGASTDGTVDLLRSYDTLIRWVSEIDDGEFHARNRALHLATGNIIHFFSDDDVHVPGALECAAKYFIEDKDLELLFGQCVTFYEDASGNHIVSDNAQRCNDCVTLANFVKQNLALPKSESAFFRQRVIEQIGYFDPMLKGADYEYWARAVRAGLKTIISDHVFVNGFRYELGEKGLSQEYRKLIVARLAIAWRHGTWADNLHVWLHTPLLLLKHDLIQLLPAGLRRNLRYRLWRYRQSKSDVAGN